MSYYSNGSITVESAYQFPVNLREFYYKCLIEFKAKEEEQQKKQTSKVAKR